MSNAPCLKCHNARRSTKVSELTAWLASVCILLVLVVLVVVVVVVVLIVSWQCGYSPWQAQAQWSPARFCTAAKGVLARSANPTAHRQRRSLIAPLPRPALPRLARFAIFEHAVRPLAVHAPTTAIVRKRESGLQTALHCTALALQRSHSSRDWFPSAEPESSALDKLHACFRKRPTQLLLFPGCFLSLLLDHHHPVHSKHHHLSFTMFRFTVLVAAVLATTSAVSAATVSTPTALTQCQPVLITWSDAQGKGKSLPLERHVYTRYTDVLLCQP